MSDPRSLLIFLRLAVGIALLAASALFALCFLEARRDVAVVGSAMAAIGTFGCGLYFVEMGLALSLWATLEPPARKREPEGDLPAYEDVRIERREP